MFTLSYTTGIGEDKNGKPLEDVEHKLETIRVYIAAEFGGYTESYGKGGWINPDNNHLVSEDCVRFEIVTDKDDNAIQLAKYIAFELNQASVLFTKRSVEAEFIGND